MNETAKVERFEVGQRWFEPDTGIIRTITDVWVNGKIEYTSSYLREGSVIGPTNEQAADWRRAGYALLPAAPDLTALEEQIAALTARVDALERPAEAEPTADVPRDCTGREWRPEAGWIIGPACYGSIWRFGGERWVCILSHSGTAHVGETTRSVNPPMCRILWPLAEGTEGKR
jgi:hypothetical protein